MERKFSGDTLVIASHNAGKVREINALIAPFGVRAVSAGELDLPEPVEDGDSFIANAAIKALAAAKASNLPALADDSGLCVRALGGAPGIFSARWAGPDKDFGAAMGEVEKQLSAKGAEDFSAHFVCALCLAWPDGHHQTTEGYVHGALSFPPRGKHGFGYDPIFVPTGFDITFGEMDPAQKHAMSHRADAFAKFVAQHFDQSAQ